MALRGADVAGGHPDVVQFEQVGADGEVARAAGFDFVFTHGLYTMAIATHLLLDLFGVDDPARVRRVAVRFASPTPLDSDLTVNAFGINENSFAFDALANGTTTLTHGRLELRS